MWLLSDIEPLTLADGQARAGLDEGARELRDVLEVVDDAHRVDPLVGLSDLRQISG